MRCDHEWQPMNTPIKRYQCRLCGQQRAPYEVTHVRSVFHIVAGISLAALLTFAAFSEAPDSAANAAMKGQDDE